MESLKLSGPNEDSVEERSDGEEIGIGARLSVTQSDDPPLSGGHFPLGMSKMPLWEEQNVYQDTMFTTIRTL